MTKPPYPRDWTPDEDAFLRKWAGSYSMQEIANFLKNRSRNAVIGRAHRLGIKTGRRKQPSIRVVKERSQGILKERPKPTWDVANKFKANPSVADRLPLPYEKD